MCSICDLRIEFSVDHPLSLAVAVETRRAIDAGLLPEPADAIDDGRLRLKAIDTLKAAQQRLEQTHPPEALLALPDFFVLLIESRTWGFFHPARAGFDPNCRPASPNVASDDGAARDAVLVASELAMNAMVGGACRLSGRCTSGLSRSTPIQRATPRCLALGPALIPRPVSAASFARDPRNARFGSKPFELIGFDPQRVAFGLKRPKGRSDNNLALIAIAVGKGRRRQRL
jgi:hypothetical protein